MKPGRSAALAMPLLAILLIYSCGRTNGEMVHGEWKNVYMKLEMPSYRGSDSDRVIEVTAANWERVMNIRAIHTTYRNDGTYNSPHYNLQDSLFYNPSGYWQVRNDSIIMTDTFPKKGQEYRYALRRHHDTLEFRGVEDMDGDGQADDRYFGKQVSTRR